MGHEYQIREDNNDEVSDGDEYEIEQGRPAQYECRDSTGNERHSLSLIFSGALLSRRIF